MLVFVDTARHHAPIAARRTDRWQRTRLLELVVLLVEKTTLRPGPSRGEIDATLHGELGTILSWIEAQAVEKTRKRETPAAFATGVSVSVVAGTCKRVCYNFWPRRPPTAGCKVKNGHKVAA
jgi:hypothetical protein